jgi:hypothetical protein
MQWIHKLSSLGRDSLKGTSRQDKSNTNVEQQVGLEDLGRKAMPWHTPIQIGFVFENETGAGPKNIPKKSFFETGSAISPSWRAIEASRVVGFASGQHDLQLTSAFTHLTMLTSQSCHAGSGTCWANETLTSCTAQSRNLAKRAAYRLCYRAV